MYTALSVLSLIFAALCGTVFSISVREDLENVHPDIFDSNFKLKPVREVIDEFSPATRDFPRVYPCGDDEAQNWYEPDPETCKCYYECTGTWYEHRTCPQDLLFDEKLKQCNWETQVDCGERPVPMYPAIYEGSAHNFYHPEHKKVATLSRKQHNQDHGHSHEDFSSPNFYDNEEDYDLFM